MAEPVTIKLRVCPESLNLRLSEIKSFFIDFPEIAGEFCDRVLRGNNGVRGIFKFQSDADPTGAAHDLILVFKFTESYLSFVAACRAGNVDWSVLDV